MQGLLLELWHDLREKRLWPVAVLLLVATAAVPFTLLEKREPAPPAVPTPTPTQTAADKLPTVTLEEIASRAPSDLSQFSTRNPFRPLRDLPKDDENRTVERSSPDSSAPATPASTPATPGTGSPGTDSPAPTITYFTYRADIKFGPVGKPKTMKQVEAFTLLGDDKAPAAMFMGITDDNKHAVFAVDITRYEAAGEHDCKPSPENCEFVYLAVDEDANETTLTTLDGSLTYDLEVTAIKRIVLDKEDVESVPTEEDKSDDEANQNRNVVDLVPQSLFDLFARKR